MRALSGPYPRPVGRGLNEADDCLWQSLVYMWGIFMTKSKIVATVGPACFGRDRLTSMVESGVSVFRLNFSHGDFIEYEKTLNDLLAIRQETGAMFAVMGDLCGPKIRTGEMSADVVLCEGDEVSIAVGNFVGDSKRFCTNYEFFVKDVEVAERVFVNDGRVELLAIAKDKEKVVCKVISGGEVKSNKGVNLPDTAIGIRSITDRDWECAEWAVEHGLDFLALSFVRSAGDVLELKKFLADKGSSIKVVSKIETPAAVECLEEIVDASDAVLVARGDLGVETAFAQVPLIQKRITRMCRKKGKAVIVATEMLESMIEKRRPTRAEVSDAANAVMDFADCLMLSGETAVGKWPVEAAQNLVEIAEVTEAYMDTIDEERVVIEADESSAGVGVMARNVARMVDESDVELVAIWSEDGEAARVFSKARIDVGIAAFSSDAGVCAQMCLYYGVIPCEGQVCGDGAEFGSMAGEYVLEKGLVREGERIVVVWDDPASMAVQVV